jgi:hypothetical protein
MKGGATYRNYVFSGKWQPGLTNQLAPYRSGQTYVVPVSTLNWPRGVLGIMKGLMGQRIYVGPDLPPSVS